MYPEKTLVCSPLENPSYLPLVVVEVFLFRRKVLGHTCNCTTVLTRKQQNCRDSKFELPDLLVIKHIYV